MSNAFNPQWSELTGALFNQYLQAQYKHVQEQHWSAVEDLSWAFMIRHGLDPTEAMVVTRWNPERHGWETFIERRTLGESPLRETTLPEV